MKPKKVQLIVLLPRVRELRVARAKAGVSIKTMAEQLKVSRWQLGLLLRGRRLSTPMAEAVAAYFGVPVDALFVPIDLENPNQAAAA
jgi:transcriptional regulator with XRE-family HTH domain